MFETSLWYTHQQSPGMCVSFVSQKCDSYPAIVLCEISHYILLCNNEILGWFNIKISYQYRIVSSPQLDFLYLLDGILILNQSPVCINVNLKVLITCNMSH